ncbi:MAG: hypothetical protein LUD19_05445 [Clostridia bacterium]|nr:hypothetical protein [Clostridia bacterium]
MKFKHTVNLLIDNFKTTYKLLLYRAIISVLSIAAYSGFITLFFKDLSGIEYYNNLKDTFSALFNDFLDGYFENMQTYFPAIGDNIKSLLGYFSDNPSVLAGFIAEMLAVTLVFRFLQGLGNFTASELINDKMAMQAESPFVITMIKNLGKACAYNGIYVPLSLIYDGLCVVALYYLLFEALAALPLLANIFLAVLFMILLIALKLAFATDWLPAMICGKKRVDKAMCYSFSRKSGGTLSVYTFYAFSCILIMGVNIAAAVFTFGVGTLITIPLSYVYLLCFEFANYYVNNDVKFFTDKRTIVKPEHEKETSREDFLRGE